MRGWSEDIGGLRRELGKKERGKKRGRGDPGGDKEGLSQRYIKKNRVTLDAFLVMDCF